MVILDLCVCPYLYLDVSRIFQDYLVKVGNMKVWNVHKFDWELALTISGLDCCFGSWNMFLCHLELVYCDNSELI